MALVLVEVDVACIALTCQNHQMSGHFIYSIKNRVNGKRYIGRSNDVLRRWEEHAWRTQQKSLIGRALQKHGVDSFDFEVIDSAPENRIKELEGWYIHLHE